MDTLPISPSPAPPAPAGAECAADAAACADAPQGGFQAMLSRSLAGQAQEGTSQTAGASEAPSEEAEAAAGENLLMGLPGAGQSASDSALALLAALPQQAARLAGADAGDGRTGDAAIGEPGDAIGDRPGVAGRRPFEATRGKGIALPGAGDATAQRVADTDKPGATALLEMLPASDTQAAPQQTFQAAAQAAWSPAAAGTADGAAHAQAPAARIETPLGAPGWASALADRVVMFANDKQQIAELHINPPHLGPVDITLTLSKDEASATFISPHAIVRETIESALPRLREVLAESGINLGQASVTADSPRDGSAQAQSRSSFAGGSARAGSEGVPAGVSTLAATRGARSLVDLFA